MLHILHADAFHMKVLLQTTTQSSAEWSRME